MSIIFNLNFQISEDLLISIYICWEAFFNWSSDINIWGWRWRITKVFLSESISNTGFITKISETDHLKQIEIKQNSPPTKSQYLKNKFTLLILIFFGMWISTNYQSFSKHISLCVRHLKTYLILLWCNHLTICWVFVVIHNFLPKFSLALNFPSRFFIMAVLLLQSLSRHTALEILI